MATLDAVEPELERGPRVISLSLHHHLSGVLHRVRFVEKMLDALLARCDTVFMTGGQIADWFIETDRRNDGAPNQGKCDVAQVRRAVGCVDLSGLRTGRWGRQRDSNPRFSLESDSRAILRRVARRKRKRQTASGVTGLLAAVTLPQ